MTKSEAVDKIEADYLIYLQKIDAMNISTLEKITILTNASSKAIALANAIRSSKSAS